MLKEDESILGENSLKTDDSLTHVYLIIRYKVSLNKI